MEHFLNIVDFTSLYRILKERREKETDIDVALGRYQSNREGPRFFHFLSTHPHLEVTWEHQLSENKH